MDPNNNNSSSPNNNSGTTPVAPPVVPVAPSPAPTVTPPEPTPPVAPAPAPDPATSPAPAPKIVNETSKPKVFVSTGSHKNAFILGALAIFLLVGLGVSLFLVRQQQDIRSKAASSCDMRWPADPASGCGKRTQVPAQDATVATVTPDFHWDYDTHSTDKNICDTPSGCSQYAAAVLLWDFNPTSSGGKPFARAPVPGPYSNQATPVKDAKFSDFLVCDYGHIFPNDPNTCHTDGQPKIPPLKPNTDYWWTVLPYYDGTVHAEQTWNYHFKTGSGPTAACQMVSPDKDLTKIQIGDTVKFTGYGSVSSEAEKIDKIDFIFTKSDGTEISNDILDAVRATDKDSGTNQFYVATKSAQISAAGSYGMRIRVHWQSADKWLE